MKKILFTIGLIGLIGFASVRAVTTTITLNGAAVTNIATLAGGSFTLLQATVTAPANSNVFLTIYDAPAGNTNYKYTVGAYSNIVTYATNYITSWTNYYGYTNYLTNIAIVDVTNNNNSATATYPLVYIWNVNTNLTTTYQGLNTFFKQGMLITNNNNAAAVITLQYTQ